MALNIKPLSDRVLIEPVAAETKTASGFFIPDTIKKPQKELLLQLGMAQKTHNDSENGDDSVFTEIFRYRAEIRR
jgi:chaperonin GroES